MYRPNYTVDTDPLNYIDGTDIYNSLFIYNLHKSPLEEIEVASNKLYRSDLLSKLIYGDKSNAGLLGLVNAYDYTDFKASNKVKYVAPDVLQRILSET